jgi:hypothetical protein
MDSAAVRQYAVVSGISASGSLWQCLQWSARREHAAVCGSVLGSVWQWARQCAAVNLCGSVP